MARQKQPPKKTKKRNGWTTTPLPNQKERMMNKLDATYPTDQESTPAQWDASDPRYQRPDSNRQKKTTPKKRRVKKLPVKRNSKKVCVTLMEIARKFPDIAKQVCFHPKVSSFKSIMGTPASAKRKVSTFL